MLPRHRDCENLASPDCLDVCAAHAASGGLRATSCRSARRRSRCSSNVSVAQCSVPADIALVMKRASIPPSLDVNATTRGTLHGIWLQIHITNYCFCARCPAKVVLATPPLVKTPRRAVVFVGTMGRPVEGGHSAATPHLRLCFGFND